MIERRLGNIGFMLATSFFKFFFSDLDYFEDTKFREKMLVEKVGVQTQTSSKDPRNVSLRRVAVGPNLYFCGDGSRDTDPIHYWG